MFLLKKLNFCKIIIISLIVLSLNISSLPIKKNHYYEKIYDNHNINEDFYLIIPKINLEEKISYDTSLDEGIMIKYYDKSLVLLGHSGLGYNLPFNNLDNLSLGDEINIKYNNRVVYYILENIKSFQKGSNITITNDKKYLFLITCDKFNKQKQLLFSSKIAKIVYF